MKMIKKGTKIKHKIIRFEHGPCGSVFEAIDNDPDIEWVESYSFDAYKTGWFDPIISKDKMFSFYCPECRVRDHIHVDDETTEVFYDEN